MAVRPPLPKRKVSSLPSLHLTPDHDSPGKARQFVSRRLSEWGVNRRTIEDAVLLATELVTNAVVHARTPMRLDVALDDGVVRVAVSDSDAGRPVLQEQNDKASTGRGLFMVDQVANDWSVVYGTGTKTVMFSLAPAHDEAS